MSEERLIHHMETWLFHRAAQKWNKSPEEIAAIFTQAWLVLEPGGQNMNEMTNMQKEASALSTMQKALEGYSKREGISFEEALVEFSKSGTYEELFDFDSLLWTQGPDYLMSVYEAEECNKGF